LTHRREGAPVFGFRKFLDDRDVGTVVIATPDLWHPLITVSASGKDVYVEKPVSNVVRESRLMVEAARRNKRIVQVGLLQRSSSHFRRVQVVPWGEIGECRSAQNCGGFPLIHEPNGPSSPCSAQRRRSPLFPRRRRHVFSGPHRKQEGGD
jgi:predicted dehydrogenase